MIGSQIGSYKILDKLGEGGMGIVYKAVDTSLDRIVAVKSLSAELAKNPSLEQRFRAEAKAQANLNHTNIATLYAFFVQDGTAWMVMEYIEGETVQDMIQRRGLLPAQEAVPIFRQALLGIGYAHRMGIVHRDIKPSNIMVNRNGIVKVMDFGIAKVMGNRGMTRTGTQMGTAYYMSPEQVVNKGVDVRSDIYSLGITLYEMLTANVPFTGDTDFEVMSAHIQTPPPLPTRFYPYIPKGLENAVLRAIEKNPAARFQTVEEFGSALEHPEDYQAPAPANAAAGAPLAGITRLEAPTQTVMGPPPPGFQPPSAMTPVPPVMPPPAPGVTPPPAVKPALLAGNHLKIAAGAGAIVVLAAGAFLLRPKPKPPVVPNNQAQLNSQGSNTPQQGQTEVQIPLPPAPENQKPPEQPQQPQPTNTQPPVPPPQQPNRQPQKQSSTVPQAQQPPQAAPPRAQPPPQTAIPSTSLPAPAQVPETPPAPVSPAKPALTPVTVAAGTKITVRTIGLISTRSSKQGDKVMASIETPVAVGGRIVIPKGADVSIAIMSVDQSGKIEGSAELVMQLAGMNVSGRLYALQSEPFAAESEGRGKKSGKVIGGLAAAGGAVGGIFHKKNRAAGAAEGAAAGAAAGTGVQLVTKGEAVVISPETRLTFTLRQPVDVMVQ